MSEPREYTTEDFPLADAIRKDPNLLEQLPVSLYNHEVCLAFATSAFVERRLRLYNGVLCDLSDYYMRRSALDYLECNYSLEHLLQWQDVCEIMVEYLPEHILPYISENVLTYDMCLTATRHGNRHLSDVPKKFRTAELCLLALENEPSDLIEVPMEHITYDMCLDVAERGCPIVYIPDRFVTKEVCLRAVKLWGKRIENVPSHLLDDELCIAAIHHAGYLTCDILGKIPEEHRTYPVCLAAVNAHPGNLQYVPERYRTIISLG